MAAGIYNIVIEQGATFLITVTLNDGATPVPAPIDLTGYEGRGQIKLKATDTEPLAVFEVSVTDPTAGEVEILLSAEDSEAIVTTGKTFTDFLEAQYDVELFKGDEVIRLLNGTCNISPEITT